MEKPVKSRGGGLIKPKVVYWYTNDTDNVVYLDKECTKPVIYLTTSSDYGCDKMEKFDEIKKLIETENIIIKNDNFDWSCKCDSYFISHSINNYGYAGLNMVVNMISFDKRVIQKSLNNLFN